MAKVASSFLDLPAWLKTGVVQLGLPGASLIFFQLRFFLCAGRSLDAV